MLGNYLFTKPSLGALIRAQEAELFKEIDSYPSEKIFDFDAKKVFDYFYNKYLLPAPILNENEITTDQTDTELDVSQDPDRVFLDRDRPFFIKATKFSFFIPFSGDKDLFIFQPSTYTLNPPRGEISNLELVLTYTRTSEPPEAIQASFQSDLGKIKSYLKTVANDVNQYNSTLSDSIRARLKGRKQKLLDDQKIASSFGYKVRQKDITITEKETNTMPKVKKASKPKSPSTNIQVKKIKKRLEDENLWVQRTTDGDDEHLYIGNKEDKGEKAHITVDGVTGEIRIEDNQKQPEAFVRQIKTIMTLHDGREIHNTRELIEWKPKSIQSADIASLPIIEVLPESAINNFGSQDAININVLNRTTYPLIIVSCQFDGVDTNHSSKKLDAKDVFHFPTINKDHLKNDFIPEFKLVLKTQTGAKYLFISRLLIKDFNGRFDLQVSGDEEIIPI